MREDSEKWIARAVAARRVLDVAARKYTEEMRRAVLVMRRNGYSFRDIGHALGISHQRAHQLARAR